jgi:hypothetical protein
MVSFSQQAHERSHRKSALDLNIKMDEPVASVQGFGVELKVKLFFRSLMPSDLPTAETPE